MDALPREGVMEGAGQGVIGLTMVRIWDRWGQRMTRRRGSLYKEEGRGVVAGRRSRFDSHNW